MLIQYTHICQKKWYLMQRFLKKAECLFTFRCIICFLTRKRVSARALSTFISMSWNSTSMNVKGIQLVANGDVGFIYNFSTLPINGLMLWRYNANAAFKSYRYDLAELFFWSGTWKEKNLSSLSARDRVQSYIKLLDHFKTAYKPQKAFM